MKEISKVRQLSSIHREKLFSDPKDINPTPGNSANRLIPNEKDKLGMQSKYPNIFSGRFLKIVTQKLVNPV